MSTEIPKGFWAYPSTPPRIPETIANATKEINGGGMVHLQTWQEMGIAGRWVIDQICEKIDAAQIFCADLTGLNENVMFELGYAIVKNKRIWPILDTSIAASKTQIRQFETLTGMGYTPYTNHRDIVNGFWNDCPAESLNETIFSKSIQPHLQPQSGPCFLYLKAAHDDDASVIVSRKVQGLKIDTIISDPTELALRELAWYGANIYRCEAVFCHLSSTARVNAQIDNAIYTLVAGMAYGLGKPLLMVIEADGNYLAALDVRNKLFKYQRASEVAQAFDTWIEPHEQNWRIRGKAMAASQIEKQLATELKGLYFGDPLAENEKPTELDNYFVKTAAYQDALNGRHKSMSQIQ